MSGVTPQVAVSPGSTSTSCVSSRPSGTSSRRATCCTVSVGSSSRWRPGAIPAKPAIVDSWQTGAVAVAVVRFARELEAIAPRLDPDEADAPGLRAAAGREAQRREGNGELDLVAAGGDPAGRVPESIPGGVFAVAAALALGRQVVAEEVHLDSERVDVELEGAPAVEEGVEPHADEVAVVGLVAVGEAGADRFGVGILGGATDIEPLAVVEQPAGSRDRRRRVLAGLGLIGEGDDLRGLPDGLVEHAVDLDRRDRRRGAGRDETGGGLADL